MLEPGMNPGSRVSRPGCGRGWWTGVAVWLLGLAFCAAQPASAVPILGHVLSKEGRLLSGAEVALSPVPTFLTPAGGEPPATASATTDARGDFVLDAPGPGIWRLRLAAPGHRAVVCDLLPLLDALDLPPVSLPPATGTGSFNVVAASPPRVRCRAADAEAVKATAAPGRPLGLRLLAPDGKPAAGVKAILEDGTVHGPSDAGGRLQLTLPGSSAVEARFWSADGAWAAVLVRPPAPGSPPAGDVDVRLRPAAALAGTVLDRVTRRPLAQALVWPTADPGRAAWTDARGRFTLQVPFLNAPALQAAAAGYQVATVRTDSSPGGGQPGGLILSLAPAATVDGLAVDEAGRPVPGAEVEVVPAETSLPAGEVSGWSRTDAAGRFRLDGLAPGERLTARVRATGFAALESSLPPLTLDPATAVRLALRLGRTVLGRVVDAGGRPVPGAEVRAHPSDPSAQPETLLHAREREMRRTTGRDGGFSFAAVGAGQIDLWVRAKGASPKGLQGVEVPPGSAPLDLGRIVLGPEVALRGTVVDDAGAPVPGARVTAAPVIAVPRPGDFAGGPPPAGLTDGNGQFALGGVETGVKLLVRAERDGFLPATLEVEPAADPEPVVLALQPAEALRGTVVDEDASPVAGARIVLLTRQGGGRLRPLAAATSDQHGAFSFAAVPPGSHRLSAQAAGYRAWSQPLTIDPDSPARPVEVQLARGAALSGRVVSDRGQPVEGAQIALSSGEDEESMMGLTAPGATSDGEGTYRLEGLPSGPQRVQVLHPDYLPERRQLQLDGEATLDFTLRSGAALAGQVVDEQNEPVAGAMVSVAAETDPVSIPPRWTDAAGRFRIPGLAPARYAVVVEQDEYAPVELAGVEVGRGKPDLLVRLTHGATLFGQVHGLGAEDRARLQVWAKGPALVQLPGTVDGEGRYRIQNLGPGTWHVSARAEGLGREVSAPLDLAPDQREAFLDLEFAAGYALAGVVTRGESPVDGALVSVQGLAGESSGAITGPQGRFRIGPLAPGKYQVTVLERATGAQGSWTFDLDNDVETVFDLQVSAAPSRQGEP